jgi:hypothetical protein
MKFCSAASWLAALLLAVALAAVLAWTFRAYQSPAHIAQWLSLRQLCR